ncbi:C-type lectin domain family 4 member M-like [Micropterus dolomieu]|uniref:C-type lectin domain family 4 member M-like n=1 Tax=Micropterus dolomieu TaxID=147949 RepID=UPI001E8D7A4F|nr:C-type lectin domain family 4 member M-like [Micropterus dolomieu]
MDQLDMYVNVEKPSGNPGKKKRRVNCSENIYANEDTIQTQLKKTGPALSGGGDKRVKKSSCIAAAVFLGLLCLLLLAGLIILYIKMVQLQTSYNNLTKERDQLQTSYNNLTKERDQLQQRVGDTTKERNDLQRQLQDTEASCKTRAEKDMMNMLNNGWQFFRDGFYHISSQTKTWKESRNDCLQKGADLLIINNIEEQTFIRQFKKNMWIGLTDSETEGTWKWVDGTPMTTSYWYSGEPNGGSSENCVEIKYYDEENNWNDGPCSISHFWEKVFSNALTMYKPSTEVDNEQGSDEDEGSISSDDLELSSGDLEGEELLCADSVGQDCTVA